MQFAVLASVKFDVFLNVKPKILWRQFALTQGLPKKSNLLTTLSQR